MLNVACLVKDASNKKHCINVLQSLIVQSIAKICSNNKWNNDYYTLIISKCKY